MTTTDSESWWNWACGAVPVYTVVWVYAVGWAANVPRYSECGLYCHRVSDAQYSLIRGEVPWLIVASMVAWWFAVGRALRVARCCEVISLVVWVVSAGLAYRWFSLGLDY